MAYSIFLLNSACYLNGPNGPARVWPDRRHFATYSKKRAHAKLLKAGVPSPESNLAHEYCDCSAFHCARKLFDETPHWDVVSATSLLGAFARRGRHRDAILLLPGVLSLGIRPNEFTFGTALRSSTALGDLDLGKQLHASAVKLALRSNVFVGSSLVDLYVKLAMIQEAQIAHEDIQEPNVVSYTALLSGYLKNDRFHDAMRLFEEMPERNIVAWNAVIGGCSQVGLNEEAVNLFLTMLREGFRPNQSTYPCLLTAAANMGALGMGRSFHASSIKYLGQLDVFVSNSLISFYSKCGCLEDSVSAFESHEERNQVSWNAMICGFGQNGRGKEAVEFYDRMRRSGLKPNGITLLGLLFGCSHAGLVEEGYGCFNSVKSEQPEILTMEHYACVVDLLARSGRFEEAERFLEELPFEPGIGFWKALLGGTHLHPNTEAVESIASRILALNPKDISSYVLLSNLYSAAGNWKRVSMIRREMKEKGMKRIPGCSWIEIRDQVHVFFTGDRKHAKTDEIYMVLATFLDNEEQYQTRIWI
ncbi:pentatricopeptide repeat-containing protein At5g42450, mitochondrial-like isoform X1 [Zingiber officinale]|uniref:pentatricopeptide repeat-containing protein At5g42450, mitochondrial-like isoform X1 n=1 Tax=Zingiber officinale TaxID=94328 RepID=UPI001C4AC7F8|nr:pentatricopeptide repeat-containing protein At5g42450, mitochondrial-like isoform X1 [Zingiber officinale]